MNKWSIRVSLGLTALPWSADLCFALGRLQILRCFKVFSDLWAPSNSSLCLGPPSNSSLFLWPSSNYSLVLWPPSNSSLYLWPFSLPSPFIMSSPSPQNPANLRATSTNTNTTQPPRKLQSGATLWKKGKTCARSYINK